MPLFVDNGRQLVDHGMGSEITCSGLARVEFMGNGLACFVLYRNAIAVGSGAPEVQICGRIFAPLAACPEAVDLMLKALIEGGLASAVSLSSRFLL